MVPVQVIARNGRTGNKRNGMAGNNTYGKGSAALPTVSFAEGNMDSYADCYTVTYDSKSNIRAYYYRPSREYTY